MYDLPMSEQTRTHYEIISQESGGESQVKTRQMVKAATAVTAGGSLLVLSGLTITGTVIALTVATPLFVIFSPILVPAVITVALIITGFLASGGFGIAAIHAFSWLYRHVTESGSEKIENARRMKLGSRAHDTKYNQSNIEVHQKQQKAY